MILAMTNVDAGELAVYYPSSNMWADCAIIILAGFGSVAKRCLIDAINGGSLLKAFERWLITINSHWYVKYGVSSHKYQLTLKCYLCG